PMNIPNSTPRSANRAGSTLVLVTVFVVALFALAALAIDVGNVYTHRNRIQDAIDAASLAAVRSWAAGKSGSETILVGQTFALTNSAQSSDIQTIDPGYWMNARRTFIGPMASLPVPFPVGAVPAVR